ncbi:MAG: YdcF family protein [Verrucomicrobiota bacterium]
MKWHRRKLFPLVALLLALILTSVTGWFFPQQILTVDDGPRHADVLVVLGGGSDERMARAAELFKAGEAPHIICSGFGDTEKNAAGLMAANVPSSAIWLEPKSTTTRENAQLTIAMMRAKNLRSAIIVTSWYHSRRAVACFKHYAPDLQFFSRPSRANNRAEWQAVRRHTYSEYVKLAGYWFCYGVGPW